MESIDRIEADYKDHPTKMNKRATPQQLFWYNGIQVPAHILREMTGANSIPHAKKIMQGHREQERMRSVLPSREEAKRYIEAHGICKNKEAVLTEREMSAKIFLTDEMRAECRKNGITYETARVRLRAGETEEECTLGTKEHKFVKTHYRVTDQKGKKHDCSTEAQTREVMAVSYNAVQYHVTQGKTVFTVNGCKVEVLRLKGKAIQ